MKILNIIGNRSGEWAIADEELDKWEETPTNICYALGNTVYQEIYPALGYGRRAQHPIWYRAQFDEESGEILEKWEEIDEEELPDEITNRD